VILQLFLMALALSVAEPPPRPMSVEVIRDPITDQVRAFATVRDHRHRLVVSCDPARYDGPRISFHADRWLSRGNLFTGERPAIYRFDDHPPRRMMWDVNNRRGLLTGRSRVAAFLDELMRAAKLVIRTRDIENHRLDLVFRLREVRPAVEQALAACGEGSMPPSDPDTRL
jgi:hypothetical protein